MSELLIKLEAHHNFPSEGVGFDMSSDDMAYIIKAIRYYEAHIETVKDITRKLGLERYRYDRNTSLPPIKWKDHD